MRVALLTYNAQAGDAIGNQVAEKLAFFLDRGADVRVFMESDTRLHPAVRSHCRIVPVPEPAGESWEFLSSSDLVVVEYGQYYRLLELLPLLAHGKPRILFDYHGVTPIDLWGTQNREGLERGSTQRGLVWCADAALVHSRFTCQELCGSTAFPSKWLSMLDYPINIKNFCPGSPRRDWRKELGLEHATLLLFVGRLAPNKRVRVLIAALDQLRDLMPPVHVVIVGDDTDVYQEEARRCRQQAAERGLADRVHFTGHVGEDQLLDAYRSADLFVMPSRHEGFCIPAVEAMSCGLPVVAASAGALPETVAGAGITFTADDPGDLACQVRRVLGERVDKETRRQGDKETGRPPSVAVVSPRFGTDFVGGAETSLRTIATTLHAAGCTVEIFTLYASGQNGAKPWPEENIDACQLPVHRFRMDACESGRQQEAVRAIVEARGHVSLEIERLYLEHSVRSARLVDALRQRINQFDAVIVGPYLYGLAFDIALAFPDKTLVLPCFHDEAFARLGIWRQAYRQVGGILYHSPEERDLAEVQLGLNHPRGACVGTFLDMDRQADAGRGRRRVGGKQPYVVYCGRYLREKNVPMLLDYARRYDETNPGRFIFVFLGQGDVPIPRAPWARDLGFVEESCKRDILAGAAALAQLSRNESLSLITLEAWAQGVPVLVAADCAVLAGHLERCGGGRAVDSYESFAMALNDLWQRPEAWQRLGQEGRDYVRTTYASREDFARRLLENIGGLTVPLAEQMRRRGCERAAAHDRSLWRERFGRIVEQLLDGPPRLKRVQLAVQPRMNERVVSAKSRSVFIPVRVMNQGTVAAVPDGPARVLLRCLVRDQFGQPCGLAAWDTPLPGLVIPGQETPAAMRIPVPATAGVYQVALFAVSEGSPDDGSVVAAESSLRLLVECADVPTKDRLCAASIETVQQALAEADSKQQLPLDYLDVTHGFFAKWKQWIKGKLLGNFKHAYVDVLSRQQSAFNRQTIMALQELTEVCATLDHALASGAASRKTNEDQHASSARADGQESPVTAVAGGPMIANAGEMTALLHGLIGQLAEMRQRFALLEERLAKSGAERQVRPKEKTAARGGAT